MWGTRIYKRICFNFKNVVFFWYHMEKDICYMVIIEIASICLKYKKKLRGPKLVKLQAQLQIILGPKSIPEQNV